MTGRMYSAVFEEVDITVVQDLFELVAPSDGIVVLHSVSISQSNRTVSEMLNLLIHRGSSSGSGGTVPTAHPLDTGSPTFGGTVEVNNTTQSTESNILRAENFNILVGYFWQPTPEERIVIPPSGRIVVELQTAPGSSTKMSGTIVFEEIG